MVEPRIRRSGGTEHGGLRLNHALRTYALGAGAAALAVFIAMIAIMDQDWPYAVLVDTALVLAAWTATTFLVRRALRARPGDRVAWWFLVAGLGSEAIAETVWWIHEVGLQVDVPFPSAADAFNLLGYPLLGIGLFRMASKPTDWMPRVQAILEGVFITAAVFMVSWLVVLRPSVMDAMGAPPFETGVNFAYPALDVLLAGMALTFLARSPREGLLPLGLLAGGILIRVVGDSAYLLLELQDAYGTGFPTDITWVLGYFMIGATALLPAPPDALHPRSNPATWQRFVPWALLLTAMVFAIREIIVRPDVGGIYITTAVVIILSLAVRQSLALREVEQLQEATEQAAASARSYVENAQDMVLVMDADGQVLYANPVVCTTLRTDLETLKQQGIFAFTHPDDVAQAAEALQGLDQDSPGPVEMEVRAIIGGGVERIVSIIAADHSDDPTIGGILINARDVTEERRRQQEAVRKESMERITRERRDLINGAAHVLRTPLTPIMLQLDRLRNAKTGPLTDAQAEAVDSIGRNLDRLQETSRDIIEAFRIQSKEEFDVLRIDVARILSECIERSGVPLAVQMDGRKAWAEGDPSLVRDAFTGLMRHLAGATKGKPQPLRVLASAHIVSIIAPEPRKGMTDEEARVHLDPFRGDLDHTGGLGLYICRTALEKQGGDVTWKDGSWVLTLPVSKSGA